LSHKSGGIDTVLIWSEAIVDIDEEANKVLNVLKVQYRLKDKSQAINEMAKQYKALVLKSRIRPEYLRKLERIQKEPIIRIGSSADFRRRYGLKLMYALETREHVDRVFKKLGKRNPNQMRS